LQEQAQTHGKTITINFYNIDKSFYFVDLPGYGYSKMSKEQQIKVGKFTEEYLVKRDNIKLIIMIVDIRHNPSKDDVMMFEFLKNQKLPFYIIANKSDKIAKTKIEDYANNIRKTLGVASDKLIPFSTENRHNLELVLDNLEKNIVDF
jgi:GTP-binding protein